jgi:hypothetical protein
MEHLLHRLNLQSVPVEEVCTAGERPLVRWLGPRRVGAQVIL